jgi:NAD(P)H-flavin reductase
MAEEKEQRPCWLFFANPSPERILFREELAALSDKLDLSVIHILEDPPEDWDGETGYLTRDMIHRHLPAGCPPALQWFLCGPPPMLAAAQDQLQELGVPSGRIQVEIFNL